ncbi:MAG: glycosyltransferase family 2 protein [Anaerolineaceae bacterium]|nr:glycosyltransferase family 2 protein [Anaerolineaceae bacterium]
MDSHSPYLSILFPAHNEEARLPETLTQVEAFLQQQDFACEVIIIENASTDATLAIAEEYARQHAYVRVLHDDLPGKGRAVQKGMLAARGDYRFVCDVDLSMPITEIRRFLPPQSIPFDVAIASREAPGAIRYGEPYYRHLVGRVFNSLVRLLTLPELNDTQCGFKCFTAAAAETLFPRMTIFGWTFDVEILAIARQLKYRIIEVPIPWYYHEHSKIHVLRDSMRMALDLFLIRRNVRQGVYLRE